MRENAFFFSRQDWQQVLELVRQAKPLITDEALLAEVRAKSDYIVQTLQAAPGVKSVSGMGLMLGVETAADASAVIRECMARGVLVIKAKQKVRLLPALNIPWPLLKQAVETLCAVCAELEVQA